MWDKITVSVRELVEFLLRSGSIDSRTGGFDLAYEGSQIHRKLQKAAGASYQAEVTLSTEINLGGYTFVLNGRADGVITDSDGIMIDEIKSTTAPIEIIGEDFSEVHWAQAMCYAYMYCEKYTLDTIRIRLTYYQIDSGEIKYFIRIYTFTELAGFFNGLIERYKLWTDLMQSWAEIRDSSIKALSFPFGEYRRGQRKMVAAVYKTVCGGGKLFCQAPTGIGKTISVLFPSIKALGEGSAEKIFYLTAKTITRQAAESALLNMRDKGLRLKSVTLTAADKICFNDRRECTPETCPFADGHYDRVNTALYDLLKTKDSFGRETVEEYARKYRLCPYEFSLDLALWSDCIIADYNYVFDPRVYLRRFFKDRTGNYVFLIDEAHNLVDRAREMYSAKLSKKAFLSISRQFDTCLGKQKSKKEKLRSTLTAVNREMIKMRKDCGDEPYSVSHELRESFTSLLRDIIKDCEEWMKLNPISPFSDELLTLFFDTLTYLKTSDVFDSRYVTITEIDGSDVIHRLFCIDPSYLLAERVNSGKAAIFFSATLTPQDYFVSVLGGDENSDRLSLPSPFLRDNLCLLIADRISTKYKDRESTLVSVAEMIANTANGKSGNYMVYFPSYAYMKAVVSIFSELYRKSRFRILVQQGQMDEDMREAFLREFDGGNTGTLIGFCVMGGIFSEGIDLKGDRLIGSVIIGVGLPQISLTQDIIRSYYDEINDCGFQYAYQYPGMNKVLQAAGRMIRDDTDRGVVVLIDERFTSYAYTPLLPEHWSGYLSVGNQEQLKMYIEDFWR